MWKKLFSSDSAVGHALTKIGEIVILSILWFAMSLPIVTIGTSTAALYYAVVKSIRCGRGYPIREYLKSWKQNLLKGILLTVFLAACALLTAAFVQQLGASIEDILQKGIRSAFVGNSEQTVGLYMICGGALLLLGALFLYLFPILSRFQISAGQMLAMAFVMMIRYIHYSIALLLIAAALIYMVMRLPLGVMFAPGVWALISSRLIERAMKKYLPEPAEGEDAWWLEL